MSFDFAAKPAAGASLSVRMTVVDTTLPLPGPFPPNVSWMANAGDWLVTDFDLATGVQNFIAHDTEKVLAMAFGSKATAARWWSISNVAPRCQRVAKPSLGALAARAIRAYRVALVGTSRPGLPVPGSARARDDHRRSRETGRLRAGVPIASSEYPKAR